MPFLFLQLGAILGVAVLVALLMRGLQQPLIVGYILTGVVVGPSVLRFVERGDAIDTFGQIGVVFLLFIVGLGLRPNIIRDVGQLSFALGCAQILFTTIFGFLVAAALGYPWLTSLYLALAFSFSSTVVVLQLLSSLEEQDALYGKIAIGVLLVQDLVAMLVFLFLTSVSVTGDAATTILTILSKLFVIVLGITVLMRYAVPKIEQYFARSREVIVLFALAVCFLFAAGFSALGFSQELGALLAGVLLSRSPFHRDVALRLGPLRDFFLMMFFVVLGTQVSVDSLLANWSMIIAFSIFILIANPFIVMVLMRTAGHTLRTSFFAGLTVAQISEFSLVLLAAGATLGHLSPSIIGPATIIALVTIFVSSYLMTHNRFLFAALEPRLRRIFGEDSAVELPIRRKPIDVILFGCHRLGTGIVDALEKMKVGFIVVDHDPEVIRILRAANVPYLFGSAEDPGVLESLPLKNIRTVITTIPDVDVNDGLIRRVRERNANAVILGVANQHEQARALYEAGASYVIVPPYLGRRYLVDLLREYGLQPKGYRQERETHLRELLYVQESRQ